MTHSPSPLSVTVLTSTNSAGSTIVSTSTIVRSSTSPAPPTGSLCPGINKTNYTDSAGSVYEISCGTDFQYSDLPTVRAESLPECLLACTNYVPSANVVKLVQQFFGVVVALNRIHQREQYIQPDLDPNKPGAVSDVYHQATNVLTCHLHYLWESLQALPEASASLGYLCKSAGILPQMALVKTYRTRFPLPCSTLVSGEQAWSFYLRVTCVFFDWVRPFLPPFSAPFLTPFLPPFSPFYPRNFDRIMVPGFWCTTSAWRSAIRAKGLGFEVE